MKNLKRCDCGNWMTPIDHDDDRDFFPKRCNDCERRFDEKLTEFAKVLAGSTEDECFRFIAWTTKRIEYLRGEELKRLAGYHAN